MSHTMYHTGIDRARLTSLIVPLVIRCVSHVKSFCVKEALKFSFFTNSVVCIFRTLQPILRTISELWDRSAPGSKDSLSKGSRWGDLSKWLWCKTRVLKIVIAFSFQEHERNKEHYAKEEKEIREENLRLQRRLQLEMERREALCRHLSESESRWVTS